MQSNDSCISHHMKNADRFNHFQNHLSILTKVSRQKVHMKFTITIHYLKASNLRAPKRRFCMSSLTFDLVCRKWSVKNMSYKKYCNFKMYVKCLFHYCYKNSEMAFQGLGELGRKELYISINGLWTMNLISTI